MKPETIYFEALLYPVKHPCKKSCRNHSCPIRLQRAIAEGKLFLTQLLNLTGNLPIKSDPDVIKATTVKNSVHLSTDDPNVKAVSDTINPTLFLTAKNFN